MASRSQFSARLDHSISTRAVTGFGRLENSTQGRAAWIFFCTSSLERLAGRVKVICCRELTRKVSTPNWCRERQRLCKRDSAMAPPVMLMVSKDRCGLLFAVTFSQNAGNIRAAASTSHACIRSLTQFFKIANSFLYQSIEITLSHPEARANASACHGRDCFRTWS